MPIPTVKLTVRFLRYIDHTDLGLSYYFENIMLYLFCCICGGGSGCINFDYMILTCNPEIILNILSKLWTNLLLLDSSVRRLKKILCVPPHVNKTETSLLEHMRRGRSNQDDFNVKVCLHFVCRFRWEWGKKCCVWVRATSPLGRILVVHVCFINYSLSSYA
jgi:hypothetical protein